MISITIKTFILSVIILSVIMLSVIMLSVKMLSVIILNVIMPNGTALSSSLPLLANAQILEFAQILQI
jgi:hypothetical protein